MRMLGNIGNGIDSDKYFIRNIDILPAYKKERQWWGFCKKISVELNMTVCLERKNMNRKFCGTDGLFVAIRIGDNYLSFKNFLYTTNPVEYYALVTKENETYYFKIT